MKKYILVFKNSFSEYFAYRLNFILWRVRIVISVLITYFLWFSVYQGNSEIFGYNASQMMTYVLLISFLNGVVLSTQTQRVADEINTGDLSNFLVKPLNFFGFNIARDLSDKILNTLFSFAELVMFILILKPPFFIQTNLFLIGLFLFTVFLAALLYFEISLLLSYIGFWSKETWAPRFIFFILVTFLAGTYFPLDIFPEPIFNFLKLLPFTYIIYFPLKIYLGQINYYQLAESFTIMTSWIIFLWFITKIVWRKGLIIYTAEGK